MVANSNDLLIKHESVSKTRAIETRMLFGRRCVMEQTHAAGENKICVWILRILWCTKNATFELLGRDKSRPAMKRSSCVAMLDNNNEISVFMLSCFRTTIFPAAYQGLIVLSWCQLIGNFPVLQLRYRSTWKLGPGLGIEARPKKHYENKRWEQININ